MVIFHLNGFLVKGLRLESKEAKSISTKWLCRFYMISHGYLEYIMIRKKNKRRCLPSVCYVLYFCLLFEDVCVQTYSTKNGVHARAYVMQIVMNAQFRFLSSCKEIGLLFSLKYLLSLIIIQCIQPIQ